MLPPVGRTADFTTITRAVSRKVKYFEFQKQTSYCIRYFTISIPPTGHIFVHSTIFRLRSRGTIRETRRSDTGKSALLYSCSMCFVWFRRFIFVVEKDMQIGSLFVVDKNMQIGLIFVVDKDVQIGLASTKGRWN